MKLLVAYILYALGLGRAKRFTGFAIGITLSWIAIYSLILGLFFHFLFEASGPFEAVIWLAFVAYGLRDYIKLARDIGPFFKQTAETDAACEEHERYLERRDRLEVLDGGVATFNLDTVGKSYDHFRVYKGGRS